MQSILTKKYKAKGVDTCFDAHLSQFSVQRNWNFHHFLVLLRTFLAGVNESDAIHRGSRTESVFHLCQRYPQPQDQRWYKSSESFLGAFRKQIRLNARLYSTSIVQELVCHFMSVMSTSNFEYSTICLDRDRMSRQARAQRFVSLISLMDGSVQDKYRHRQIGLCRRGSKGRHSQTRRCRKSSRYTSEIF